MNTINSRWTSHKASVQNLKCVSNTTAGDPYGSRPPMNHLANSEDRNAPITAVEKQPITVKNFTTMNKHDFFYEISRKYGRTALRLIRQHERFSSKLARFSNHLTFLTRCIKNRVGPKDLQVRSPVQTRGARRVAELASMRFLKKRIRLTQRAKGDAKKEAESTRQRITSSLTYGRRHLGRLFS